MSGLGGSLRPPVGAPEQAEAGQDVDFSARRAGRPQVLDAAAGRMSRSSSQETVESNHSGDSVGPLGDSSRDVASRGFPAGSKVGARYRRVDRRSKSHDCILQHLQDPPDEPEEPRLLPEGMLFGIDIGGTLAKIVWREPHMPHKGPEMSEQIARLNKYFMAQDLLPKENIDKSMSVPNLASDLLHSSRPGSRELRSPPQEGLLTSPRDRLKPSPHSNAGDDLALRPGLDLGFWAGVMRLGRARRVYGYAGCRLS
jgi:hypothetical protein